MKRTTRRDFPRRSALAGCGLAAGAPAIVVAANDRPRLPYGAQSGDVLSDRAIVWSRTDRPARLIVEYATTSAFRDARRVRGPLATAQTDFTARVDLSGLPAGEKIFYRVRFEDARHPRSISDPVEGYFKTAPRDRRDLLFAWGGDTAGQGWGINPDWGGMKIYAAMRRMEPDFFIHSGDTIYADGPIQREVKLDDGSVWKNLVTPEKSKVAETLDEFRGNYRYNLLDEHLRYFNHQVPQFVQWDDHETVNNWYPGKILDDDRYRVKDCRLLAARARRAFLDYTPIRAAAGRIYRAFPYGPSLEVLMLDLRSYRGPNTANRQAARGRETDFMGGAQLKWLKSRLLASRATWKVIASDMPIGLVVGDGKGRFENAANGDGPPLGRELEFADLFRFIKQHDIRNVVWLTADVHYAAAHYYDPNRAQFTDFLPFWEFVAGPLNAGTFGPGELDNTFGPRVKFVGVPPGMKPNRPPSAGLQFFGTVWVDGKTGVMTVRLHDLTGKTLYSMDLAPAAR